MRAATPLRKLITWLVVTLALVGSGVLSADLAGAATQTYSTVGTVPVRAGKGTSTAQLGSLPKGAHVLATGKASGDWQPIRYESTTGYVQRRYLKADAKPATRFTTGPSGRKTTTARVYLRTGSSLSSSIVRTYPKGAVVEVTGISGGDYTQVKADGTAGWMATRLLSKTTNTRPATVAGYTATTTLALRASASVSASSLASIAVGKRVDGTGTHSGGYTQVVFGTRVGWVITGYLKAVAGTPKKYVLPLRSATLYTKNAVTLRMAADAESDAAAKLGKDEVLRATGATKNSYTAVIWNGSVVWTASSSLTTRKPAIVDLGSASLNKLQAYGKLAVLAIRDEFPQISTMYGWRASSSYSEDHPSGRAVDVMIPSYKTNKALGDKVAQYLIDNAKKLHVNYVIWRQRSYSIERGSWKKMDDRGGDTANHYDHVHVSFFQTP
ncbi:SH3 domain-containing protein [Propionicimonas paludicola]|uniref:SH3 domain-containing protein n=1 Tax=Propionicimonas paludicola TaxID=185243 RepID=A0A2A9CSA3_9ACTN|nr:SH3 domain-containing protein [Propionicimonas paludicola]PFG17248.1 SH3 domain-containing protein [Propionicimonas paludicola]